MRVLGRLLLATGVSVMAVLLAAEFSGCGKAKEKAQDKIASKTVENAIKAGAKQDGKDVDVHVDSKKGGIAIKTKDPSTGQDVDIKVDGNKVKMTGADGAKKVEYTGDGNSFTMQDGNTKMTSGKGAKLPDGFPKDVPMYAGAEIEMGTSVTDEQTFMVRASTTDPLDKVTAKFKADLAANGWKEENAMVQSGAGALSMLNYAKDQRNVMVSLMTENAKTTITVSVSKK